jgi:hypothetical protein
MPLAQVLLDETQWTRRGGSLDSIGTRASRETERRADLFPLAANNFSERYTARPMLLMP